MLFNSLVFLFAFFPIVLGCYFLLKEKYRNIFLLLASLVFYAWGEAEMVLLMILVICFNYIIGLKIDHRKQSVRKGFLWFGIAGNLAVLLYFKYFLFLLTNLNYLNFNLPLPKYDIVLPIGLSFFIFQSISYLVDVYQTRVPPQNNLFHLGLYISLFPQLVAGPIIRYEDIFKEIKKRTIDKELFVSGILKFIRGLAKKVIIANNIGFVVDKALLISPPQLGTSLSWLVITGYALQIYFDFSGYSDMAIGLGRMFGFRFKENFLHPYSSKSIREFWRRWHISLSQWFRDYVYIPLGGSKVSNWKTYRNLLIVFFITGLWHGASWNFVIWGMYHGVFLLIERNVQIQKPEWMSKKLMDVFSNFYLIVVVLIGWVFFRIEDFDGAIAFIKTLFSFTPGSNKSLYFYFSNYWLILFVLGILFSFPLRERANGMLLKLVGNKERSRSIVYFSHSVLFLYAVIEVAQSNYNPFIYFKF